MSPRPLDRIAVALDTSDWSRFVEWCRLFGPHVGLLKVGLEAFLRWGPAAVERAVEEGGAVFLDLKLHDIPNTVAAAARAAARPGVRFVTAHAGGGEAMLQAAVKGAGRGAKVLAVTLLTHLDEPELERLGLPGDPSQRVLEWASMARRAGCAGAVCSPQELPQLRSALPRPFLLVTPGVRPAGAPADDQRRVATPGEALSRGADFLVIGRPLTRAEDPARALAALEAELAGAPVARPRSRIEGYRPDEAAPVGAEHAAAPEALSRPRRHTTKRGRFTT
jgi:orotidine-5'-phosphate decarboxylase